MDTRLDTMAEQQSYAERQRQQLDAAITERNAARAELLNTREELGAIRVILATEQNSWKTP